MGDYRNQPNLELQPNPTKMSAIEFDPDDSTAIDLDDRNADIDPDFELNDELAYNIGWDEPDLDEAEKQAQLEFEARLTNQVTEYWY